MATWLRVGRDRMRRDGRMTILRTPRLVLRRWREADVVPLGAINGDPEVTRWIGDGTTRDLEQTSASVAALERQWEETGMGLFAVQVLATAEMAGLTGLAVPHFLPEIMPAIEIAWRFGQPLWGHADSTSPDAGYIPARRRSPDDFTYLRRLPQHAAKADMPGRGVDGLALPGGRAIAQAVIRRAQM